MGRIQSLNQKRAFDYKSALQPERTLDECFALLSRIEIAIAPHKAIFGS
jgi:hypothetical protein